MGAEDCCDGDWSKHTKLDRILRLGASPAGGLCLMVQCCAKRSNMRPLAIPWAAVKDNGEKGNLFVKLGQLALDDRAAHFRRGVRQCSAAEERERGGVTDAAQGTALLEGDREKRPRAVAEKTPRAGTRPPAAGCRWGEKHDPPAPPPTGAVGIAGAYGQRADREEPGAALGALRAPRPRARAHELTIHTRTYSQTEMGKKRRLSGNGRRKPERSWNMSPSAAST